MKELLRFVNHEKKLEERLRPDGNNKGLVYNALKHKQLFEERA
jgi:hypothetical protein